MASYNRVTLLGNLTRDPELRYIPSGTAVSDIGLAVNDRRKGPNGDWIDETTFVDVDARGYQLFDGHWYGQRIFGAYLQSRGLGILTEPTSTEVYGLFAAQSVPGALQDAGAFMIAGFMFVGLVVLAHVISKPTIAKLSSTVTKPTPTRLVPRTRADFRNLERRAQYVYVTYQPLVTLALFVTLTAVFFAWPFQYGLALAFLMAVAPAALHLLLYPTDLSNGGFLDRFSYMAILILLVVTLYGWPQLYGTSLFDPEFPIVSVSSAEGNCDERQMERGPRFVAFEKHNDAEKRDERMLLRLCFSHTDGKRYVDFFSDASEGARKGGRLSLTQAVNAFVLPENIASRTPPPAPPPGNPQASPNADAPVSFLTTPAIDPPSLRLPGAVAMSFVAATRSEPTTVEFVCALADNVPLAFKLADGTTAKKVTWRVGVGPAPGALIDKELSLVRAGNGDAAAVASIDVSMRPAGSNEPAQSRTVAVAIQR
jgi:hypothetical protein